MKQDCLTNDKGVTYFEPVIYPDTQFLIPTRVKTDRSFEAHPNLLNGLKGASDLTAVVDIDKRTIVALTGSREAAMGVQIGLTHAGIHHDEFGVYFR